MRGSVRGLLLCFALAACGPSKSEQLQSENEELRVQVEQLQSQLSEIKEKAESLETSSNDLRDQMARFQSENWREVVPEAEAASSQVESDQDDLKSSIDDADQ
jgi:TolA-binding protein